MISGMVGRLDARLRANPQDLQGWVMLMRARMVLGDAPAAADAYRRAMAAFHGAPDDQAQLTRAADGLGVPKA
jgi:cytochrome c-type biogenesis protein CcmH